MMKKLFDDNNEFDTVKEELLSKLDLKGKSIPDFFVFPLLNYLDDKEKCQNCPGIEACSQRSEGYQPVLDFDKYQISYKECEYKKKVNENAFISSFVDVLYLPKKILDARISDFYINTQNRKVALRRASDFIVRMKNHEETKGMLLSGEYGAGKTYLMAAIANELAKNSIKTILMYFPDLVRELKSDFNQLDEKINMLKTVDVLMIDDLGSENITPWVRDEILGPVLQYRMLDNKPTFFSTNLDNNKLIKHLSIDDSMKGGRIFKRITDLCEYVKLD